MPGVYDVFPALLPDVLPVVQDEDDSIVSSKDILEGFFSKAGIFVPGNDPFGGEEHLVSRMVQKVGEDPSKVLTDLLSVLPCPLGVDVNIELGQNLL